MTDFKSIENFHIKFTRAPHDNDLHNHLNSLFSDLLPGHERLFTSDVQDEVLDDSALITTLKQIIAKEMIKPIATQTPDVSHIMPIINAAPIKVLANKATKLARRLTKTALTAALENARRKGEDTIEIHISTVSMHYDNSVVMDLTNWTNFSTNAPSQVPASANKPATAAEIGQATAQAI
eukprot:scaffold258_cov111-Cylindrotheca_fusiformis.AAC.1